MSPYSGLLELFEGRGVLVKSGNSLEYTSPITGEVIKASRKKWTEDKLDIVMSEWNNIPDVVAEEDLIDPIEVDVEEVIDES